MICLRLSLYIKLSFVLCLFCMESHMQPKIVYRLAVVIAVLVVASASVISIKLMAHASQDQPFVLQGQYVPLTAHAQVLGAASGQQQLNLSIGLQLRNQEELDTLLSEVYNPRALM